ncbi:IclR family transcriptional regulator [Pollutimonas thiosulfatoxidans]|nr:IclR family transcriptional regulator [Pollutimonas thiosulfatoxidans]
MKSVERTFLVLEAFGKAQHPLTLAEIAQLVGIDKSGAQRICYTLQALGYLERAHNGRGLVPGKKILERSFDYLRYNPLIERAAPILVNLRRDLQERVDLSLFDDLTVIYAYRLLSKRDFFYANLAGRRVPTFLSSGGRAIMAHLPDDEVNSILARSDLQPRTVKSTTDVKELWQCIKQARQDGYAVAVEQWLLGEIAIASAILDSKGRPIAAIHVSASLAEWTPEAFCHRIGPRVIEATRALSGA